MKKYLISFVILGCFLFAGALFFTTQMHQTTIVKLYYYNWENDKDADGNVACSKNGLVAVDREVPKTEAKLESVLNLLLKGELSDEERAAGITTEYPLSGLKLTSVDLDEGVLTLGFDDPEFKTGGGSCRVGVLWNQIEATALQFPEVQEVRFTPEWLFQP